MEYTGQQKAYGQIQSASVNSPNGILGGECAPERALDQHEKALAALVGHLENLTQRVGAVADRVFGPQPQPVGAGDKPMANPPAMRRLEDLVAMGHMRLGALSDYVQRLERL